MESPPERARAGLDGKEELLKLDYEQTFETFRQLVDIRFKLLGFVPTLTAVAVALLTATAVPSHAQLAVGALGFVVTLGTIVYDQRNTQFHNGANTRLACLEELLGFPAFETDPPPGLIGSRRYHKDKHLLGIPIYHDVGLAFIYGAALGGWAFAAADAIARAVLPDAPWVAVGIAVLVGVVVSRRLLLLNPPRKPTKDPCKVAWPSSAGTPVDSEPSA
jgi:hypothetical protein